MSSKVFKCYQYNFKREKTGSRFVKKFMDLVSASNKSEALDKIRNATYEPHLFVEEVTDQPKANIKNIYCADFETTTTSPTRVWAFGIKDLAGKRYNCGGSIEEFMKVAFSLSTTKKGGTITIYFHNLKFDGQFVLVELEKRGFVLSDNGLPGTYYPIVNKFGQYFYIDVNFTNVKGAVAKIRFRDSLKKIPLSVKDMAERIGMDIEKLDIDYDYGNTHTFEEAPEEIKNYIYNDVEILRRGLLSQYDLNMTGPTLSSDSFHEWLSTIGGSRVFMNIFPQLSFDEYQYIRESYKGGWNFCNGEQKVGEGLILDFNSAYPFVMRNELLPYGQPVWFSGKYKEDEDYPLYIQHILCDISLKDGKLPAIQSKSLFGLGGSLVEKTDWKLTELYLTNIDLELLFEHYDVNYIEYIDGVQFMGARGFFDEFIDKNYELKMNAQNLGERLMSKLKINSLYGYFGMSMVRVNKVVKAVDGVVKTVGTNQELVKGRRVDMSSFITSYVRRLTITLAQRFHDEGRFIYSDTDSVHIKGQNIPEDLKERIDSHELGKLKIEKRFSKGIYIGTKCYADYDEEWSLTCAGLDKEHAREIANFENFEELFKKGTSFKTNRAITVEGGVVINEQSFTIL